MYTVPSTTFFHLPQAKREKLLQCARDEFSRVPFDEASINRIVHQAEISRGSFYMYFTDKADLFRYLLQCYLDDLTQLMVQAGPKVHGNGTYLYLHTDWLLAVREEHRYLDNHVVAPVSVGLGILYIILHRNHLYIILPYQHIRNFIDIIQEGTDNPDSGHIIQIFLHGLQ